MPKMTQLTVVLENKPGQLAKLGSALKKAKVNILAISVVDSIDTGVVRLIADSVPKATKALAKVGMAPSKQIVLGVTLPNQPGALQATAATLSAAGVNINYVYGSVAKKATEGLIILGVDNIDAALKALA
ncbi:MAG: ACT domain-containing protein [Candidatus Zipacnadales bacterium]